MQFEIKTHKKKTCEKQAKIKGLAYARSTFLHGSEIQIFSKKNIRFFPELARN